MTEENNATGADRREKVLETGKQDNLNSHRFGLVTVIYSLVLFLLGIANTFRRSPNRIVIMGTAVVLLAFGVVLMLNIPMPEGFNLFSYLGAN